MYERSICQVDKDWLSGKLHECVVDPEGNVIALCGPDGETADAIAAALNRQREDKPQG